MFVELETAAGAGAGFAFEPGAMVDHIDGGWGSIVEWRTQASNGDEFYGVHVLDGPCRGEGRMFDGAVLVPILTSEAKNRTVGTCHQRQAGGHALPLQPSGQPETCEALQQK